MKASDAAICRVHRRAANGRRIAKVHYATRLEYAIPFRTARWLVRGHTAGQYVPYRTCMPRTQRIRAEQIRAVSKARVGTRSGGGRP